MVKGWKKTVRITTASRSAWMMTLTFSHRPPWLFSIFSATPFFLVCCLRAALDMGADVTKFSRCFHLNQPERCSACVIFSEYYDPPAGPLLETCSNRFLMPEQRAAPRLSRRLEPAENRR